MVTLSPANRSPFNSRTASSASRSSSNSTNPKNRCVKTWVARGLTLTIASFQADFLQLSVPVKKVFNIRPTGLIGQISNKHFRHSRLFPRVKKSGGTKKKVYGLENVKFLTRFVKLKKKDEREVRRSDGCAGIFCQKRCATSNFWKFLFFSGFYFSNNWATNPSRVDVGVGCHHGADCLGDHGGLDHPPDHLHHHHAGHHLGGESYKITFTANEYKHFWVGQLFFGVV